MLNEIKNVLIDKNKKDGQIKFDYKDKLPYISILFEGGKNVIINEIEINTFNFHECNFQFGTLPPKLNGEYCESESILMPAYEYKTDNDHFHQNNCNIKDVNYCRINFTPNMESCGIFYL